jgi:hypothetical protein
MLKLTGALKREGATIFSLCARAGRNQSENFDNAIERAKLYPLAPIWSRSLPATRRKRRAHDDRYPYGLVIRGLAVPIRPRMSQAMLQGDLLSADALEAGLIPIQSLCRPVRTGRSGCAEDTRGMPGNHA